MAWTLNLILEYVTPNADADIKVCRLYAGKVAVVLGATTVPFAQNQKLTVEGRDVLPAQGAPDARDAVGAGARDAQVVRVAQQNTAGATSRKMELSVTLNVVPGTNP